MIAVLLGSCTPRTDRPTPSPPPSPRAAPTAAVTPTASPSPGSERTTGPTFRFAAVGDIGDGSQREARVAEGIARAHAAKRLDLVLLLGDLIYPDGNPAEYQQKFAAPYRPVLEAGIPTAAVLGNHDIRTDPVAFQRLFGMPGRYYTLVRGDVELFALDTSRGKVDGQQRAWLERELADSTSPWRIAFMHVPLYSSGMHGPNLTLQRQLADLFDRYDVQLVLAGHDHDYERTTPIRGTTYVVSGGGCCPRPLERLRPFTAASAVGLGFVVVEVSRDSLRITAVNESGGVIDSAEIVREPVGARP